MLSNHQKHTGETPVLAFTLPPAISLLRKSLRPPLHGLRFASSNGRA
jgi:hypothetical protein